MSQTFEEIASTIFELYSLNNHRGLVNYVNEIGLDVIKKKFIQLIPYRQKFEKYLQVLHCYDKSLEYVSDHCQYLMINHPFPCPLILDNDSKTINFSTSNHFYLSPKFFHINDGIESLPQVFVVLCPSNSRTCSIFEEIPSHCLTLNHFNIQINSIVFKNESNLPKTDGTVYLIGFAVFHSSNITYRTKLSLVTFLDRKSYFANYSTSISNLGTEIFKIIVDHPLTNKKKKNKCNDYLLTIMNHDPKERLLLFSIMIDWLCKVYCYVEPIQRLPISDYNCGSSFSLCDQEVLFVYQDLFPALSSSETDFNDKSLNYQEHLYAFRLFVKATQSSFLNSSETIQSLFPSGLLFFLNDKKACSILHMYFVEKVTLSSARCINLLFVNQNGKISIATIKDQSNLVQISGYPSFSSIKQLNNLVRFDRNCNHNSFSDSTLNENDPLRSFSLTPHFIFSSL